MVLAHARVGDGARPLVVLHGFLGSARNVASLSRALAGAVPDATVVALDLAGHGVSPPLPDDADLAALARDVLQTARVLRLPAPVAIVGHSLGGRVALRASQLDDGALSDVVLLDIGPSPVPAGGEVADVLDALLQAPAAAPTRELFRRHFRAAGLGEALVEWLLLNLRHDGDGYRWGVDRRALARLHERTAGEDLWPAVEGPRTWRVRCIRGERSGYVTSAEAARLEAAGCPVTTMAGAGHFLHVDRPAPVLDAVARHFERGIG